MLLAAKYMYREGVCHPDMDVSNLLVTANGKHVLSSDLAMAIAIPANGIPPLGRRWGKQEFIAPEIYSQRENCCALQVMIWSCVCNLFCLMAGKWLHERPDDADLGYRYATSGAFVRPGIPDFLEPHQRKAFEQDILSQVQQMSPQLRDFFDCSFREDPSERLTLHQIWQHEWMEMGE